MVEGQNTRTAARVGWQPMQLAVMCVVCLATGGVAGYLLRASAPVQAPAARAVAAATPTQAMGESSQTQAQQVPHEMPTLKDMKRMADMKAAPLLAKLKSD